MRDFYIELNSNGSKDVFSNNTNVNFRNRFASPISIPPHYEVGLAEFSYVPAIETLDYNGKLEVFDFLYEHPNKKYGKYHEDIKIRKGNYSSSQCLADEINSVIARLIPRFAGVAIFGYSAISQTFFVNASQEMFCSIFIYGKLLYSMGIIKNASPAQTEYIIAGSDKLQTSYIYKGQVRPFYDDTNAWTADAREYTHFEYLSQVGIVDTLCIYSDTTTPMIHADGNYSILRSCAVQGVPDKRTIERFDLPHYLPCARQYFEDINIQIKDLWGNFVRLMSGFVRLKLHFRPRSL